MTYADSIGYIEVQGWTEDGRYLVYERGIEYGEGIRRRSDTRTYVIIDGRSGQGEKLDEASYKAWLKQHPIPEAPWTMRTSPNEDQNRHEIIIRAKEGRWDSGTYDHYFAEWKVEGPATQPLTCVLKGERSEFESHTFKPPKGTSYAHVTFTWSPDGRRIAWLFSGRVIRPPAKGEEDAEVLPFGELFIDRTWGPRIQVGGSGIPPEALESVAVAIEKAGFAPTSIVSSGTRRHRTVIRARKEYQEDAKKMATGIPGGASIEPLTGNAQFDVVVEAGRSANKP
jgi:hypothetical protein